MKRLLVMFALFLPSPALAQADDYIAAINNVSYELVTCTAYYSIVANGIRGRNEGETADQYDEAAFQAFELATMMGNEIGLSEAANLARLELELDDMVAKIDGNYVNISILIRDYSESCVALSNNPAARVAEFLIETADEELRDALREAYRADGVLP